MNAILLTLLSLSVNVDDNFVNKCLKPTVVVSQGDEFRGTGFIIKSVPEGKVFINTVVTVNHLFTDEEDEATSVSVSLYDANLKHIGYKAHPAMILATNASNDLAIVVFRSKEVMPCVELDYDPIKLGDKVCRVGYGLKLASRWDEGQITQLEHPVKHLNLFRTNIFCIAGDSGSPIFRDGKVVGVLSMVSQFHGNFICSISFGITIERIKALKFEVLPSEAIEE